MSQRSPVEISPIKRGLFEDIRRLWDQFQAEIGHFTLYCYNEMFGVAKAKFSRTSQTGTLVKSELD